jgi:hypothetical protein
VRTENIGCALYIRCALSTGKYGTSYFMFGKAGFVSFLWRATTSIRFWLTQLPPFIYLYPVQLFSSWLDLLSFWIVVKYFNFLVIYNPYSYDTAFKLHVVLHCIFTARKRMDYKIQKTANVCLDSWTKHFCSIVIKQPLTSVGCFRTMQIYMIC